MTHPPFTESAPRPAPGRLELVRQFVNTCDVERGVDAVAEAEPLRAWLAERDLLGAGERLGKADVERAVEVREALRALLAANAGEGLDAGAVDALNRAARSARLVVCFDDAARARLAPDAGGVEGAVGQLLGVVSTAMVDGTWPRLKACRNGTCAWAFYDHSKNRSGRWCDMGACGNTVKARAYRRRRAGRDSS